MLDPDDPLFPLYLACAITTALFTGASAAAWVAAYVRYARIARDRQGELGGLWDGMAPLWYGGSLAFGVGGIVAGFYLLRTPRTARQGYACVVIGAAHVVALVVVTCVVLIALTRAYGPRWLLGSSPIVPSSWRTTVGA